MKSFCVFIFTFISLFSEGLDVIIPLHEKDRNSSRFVVRTLKNRVKNIRNIYIISKERLNTRAMWVDETLFPFSLDDVGGELGLFRNKRRGWYFQQLLKFYAPQVIEGLSDNFLVFDGDTKINHEMEFISKDGKVYLDKLNAKCRCKDYHNHMYKVLPNLGEIDRDVNPIVHHMVFSKVILNDLFSRVEEREKIPFWKVFLHAVDVKDNELPYTGASEYLIYFHFCKKYHGDKIIERTVNVFNHARDFHYPYPPEKYDFVSVHKYN